MLGRDQSLRPAFWSSLGTSGNVFANPPAPIDSVSGLPWNPNATGGDSMQSSTERDLQPEVKNKTETQYQCGDLQSDHQSGIFSFQRKGFIHRILGLIKKKLQISELQFDKFPTPSMFSCKKTRLKTQESACSSSPSEAVLCI